VRSQPWADAVEQWAHGVDVGSVVPEQLAVERLQIGHERVAVGEHAADGAADLNSVTSHIPGQGQ